MSTVVLGARGMLGSHMMRALERDGVDANAVGERFADTRSVVECLERLSPTAIVGCIGSIEPDASSLWLANVTIPRAAAAWAAQNDAFHLHISTNAVFAPHPTRRWLPTDEPCPSTPYEMSKAAGEDPRSYVVRTTFIGRSPKGVGLLDRLLAGEPYRDRLWNGVVVDVLADHLTTLVRRRAGHHVTGVEHVHSPQPVLVSELAVLVGSRSTYEGEQAHAHLLGGGRPFPDLATQVCRYLEGL